MIFISYFSYVKDKPYQRQQGTGDEYRPNNDGPALGMLGEELIAQGIESVVPEEQPSARGLIADVATRAWIDVVGIVASCGFPNGQGEVVVQINIIIIILFYQLRAYTILAAKPLDGTTYLLLRQIERLHVRCHSTDVDGLIVSL